MTSSTLPSVAIVGSGITGSALAWALASRGAPVTVLDEGNDANRATFGSFAWINAHRPDDRHYFDLRLESMRLWREAAAEIGGLPVRFSGVLNWEGPPEEIEELQRALDEGGNPARLVSRTEIMALEPALADPPVVAIAASAEGVADPDRIAQAFLAAARAAGATVHGGTKVTGIVRAGNRVTGLECTSGQITADRVIVAAGAATAGLLGMIGVKLPMDNALGLLLRTQPVPPVTRRVLTSTKLHVWQMFDGRLIVGEDFTGTPVGEDRAATEARVLGKLEGFFEGVGGYRIDASTVTPRPTPADGYPVVGRVPGQDGLFVATMHSGVTLAPVMAAHLTRELLEDIETDALAPYRIDRFA